MRLPGCMERKLNGVAFFDLNHSGSRDPGEPGIPGVQIAYSGLKSGTVRTDVDGRFTADVPADPLYGPAMYTVSAESARLAGWKDTARSLRVSLDGPAEPIVAIGRVCTAPNRGGATPAYWASRDGRAVLHAHDPAWRTLLNSRLGLNFPDTKGPDYQQLRKWLGKASVQTQLAATTLNISFGKQDGTVTVHDPVEGDWPSVEAMMTRIAALSPSDAKGYRRMLERLNTNTEPVTPSSPAGCPPGSGR